MNRQAVFLATFLTVGVAFGTHAVTTTRGSSFSALAADGSDQDDSDSFSERDEFRQTYKLSLGSQVMIKRINGSVTIETSEGDTAEVYIVRSARTREDLNFHKVIVEASPKQLLVEGEKYKDEFEEKRKVRQRIILKLPHSVNLAVSGINGSVRATEIDGDVNVSGVNGSVVVKQANSFSEISGINGSVMVGMSRIGEKGLKISGVNGQVECQFGTQINANLMVSGVNGAIDTNSPNLTMQGAMSSSSFTAKIGSGGPLIKISGINGGVRFKPAQER